MARILIYKVCGTPSTGNTTTEVYWDTDVRDQVTLQSPVGTTCSPYTAPVNTKLDSWCDGSTLVEIFSTWDGTGRPPRMAYTEKRTANSGTCSVTTCGLKIESVLVVQNGSQTTITIIVSGYTGPVEYSLNGFVDVQDSNVFTGNYTEGSYIAYARAKN